MMGCPDQGHIAAEGNRTAELAAVYADVRGQFGLLDPVRPVESVDVRRACTPIVPGLRCSDDSHVSVDGNGSAKPVPLRSVGGGQLDFVAPGGAVVTVYVGRPGPESCVVVPRGADYGHLAAEGNGRSETKEAPPVTVGGGQLGLLGPAPSVEPIDIRRPGGRFPVRVKSCPDQGHVGIDGNGTPEKANPRKVGTGELGEFAQQAFTLVGDAVAVVVCGRPVGEIAFIEYAVVVAVRLALVGDVVVIAVDARAAEDVAFVGDAVVVAVRQIQGDPDRAQACGVSVASHAKLVT